MNPILSILLLALSVVPPASRLPGADAPAATIAPSATKPNKCASKKLKATGTYMKDVLSCHAKPLPDGSASQACLAQAESTLLTAFATFDSAGGCGTTGDGEPTTDRIDTSVDGLLTMVGGPSAAVCTKKKVSAMAADASKQHACYASAASKGAGFSVDSACQGAATDVFLEKFAKAETRADCVDGTANGPTVDLAIRLAVSGSRATLSNPVTSCAPVEVTEFHGDSFLGNARLSRITGGQVACMQADDATLATCAFSTAPGSASGEWLESPDGTFALAGQAISLTGIPGGEYIVAAKVSDKAPAACVETAGFDTAGWTPDGRELVQSCVVEEVLSAWNAMSMRFGWFPLENHADREVCSADRIHPDGATLIRSYPDSGTGPDDTFCYSGPGAALNDINGLERDIFGNYINDEAHCHYIQSGGFEVPGAKRPATKTLPLPTHVNTRSPIVWRPVATGVGIANEGGLPPVQLFMNKGQFLGQTGASAASGPLPDLGVVAEGVNIGSLTFSLARGGDSIAIGAAGTEAAPDWYPLMDGNEIALGYEALQVQTAGNVFSMGFDFVEPDTTMPAFGGTPVDSTYDLVLYSGATEVGRTTFNAPDDQVTFIGVWSTRAFDRAIIVDRSGSDDDEFLGEFFTGTIRLP